jgi:hypothetical protein
MIYPGRHLLANIIFIKLGNAIFNCRQKLLSLVSNRSVIVISGPVVRVTFDRRTWRTHILRIVYCCSCTGSGGVISQLRLRVDILVPGSVYLLVVPAGTATVAFTSRLERS